VLADGAVPISMEDRRKHEDLVDWAESMLGSLVAVADRSWPHERTLVLELHDRSGERWFLKQPSDQARFSRELHAYETVLGAFGDQVPRLVGSSGSARCLLFSALPGELARGGARAADPEVHRQAGEFLARLHASLPPEPAVGMGEGLADRRVEMLRRATGLIGTGQLAFLHRATEPLELPNPMTVLCHLDFWTRNWMVDHAGTLRVFDFGQAGRDLAVRDFGLLARHAWLVNPDLQDAFFAGYGRRLTEAEQRTTDGFVALSVLRAILRAHNRGDRAAFVRARRTLTRLDGTAVG
jgi:aminoglycoside phosphotransferase